MAREIEGLGDVAVAVVPLVVVQAGEEMVLGEQGVPRLRAHENAHLVPDDIPGLAHERRRIEEAVEPATHRPQAELGQQKLRIGVIGLEEAARRDEGAAAEEDGAPLADRDGHGTDLGAAGSEQMGQGFLVVPDGADGMLRVAIGEAEISGGVGQERHRSDPRIRIHPGAGPFEGQGREDDGVDDDENLIEPFREEVMAGDGERGAPGDDGLRVREPIQLRVNVLPGHEADGLGDVEPAGRLEGLDPALGPLMRPDQDGDADRCRNRCRHIPILTRRFGLLLLPIERRHHRRMPSIAVTRLLRAEHASWPTDPKAAPDRIAAGSVPRSVCRRRIGIPFPRASRLDVTVRDEPLRNAPGSLDEVDHGPHTQFAHEGSGIADRPADIAVAELARDLRLRRPMARRDDPGGIEDGRRLAEPTSRVRMPSGGRARAATQAATTSLMKTKSRPISPSS